MILKLSMKHRVPKQCPIGSPIRLNWENNDFFLMREMLQQMTTLYVYLLNDTFIQKMIPDCLPLSHRYMHVYDHYFSNIFSETAWAINTKFHTEPDW